MKNLKCPKCGTAFQVDDNDYAAILSQVRSEEFNGELARRVEELKEQFKAKEDAVRLLAEKKYEEKLSDRQVKMGELEKELTRLQGVIAAFDATKDSALSELKGQKEKEMLTALSEKDRVIAELKAKIENKDNEHHLAIIQQKNADSDEIRKKEQEIIQLKAEMATGLMAAKERESQLREQHKLQLEDRQAEIDRLKDFKMRLSTKMVGESLEQHCATEFERAQSMGAFQDAMFIKDNTTVEGTKGDFIFRDYYNGEEYVSIMFEMKNEVDTTATKHRNDDFLDKLDKDRVRKNCEYAVLVSMLEQGNELYDSGIVDKSHRYPRMIVIRPQFFLPVLRLITESAKKGFVEKYAIRQELMAARSQSVDFSKFEEKINRFRDSFSKSVNDAHKKFVAAYDGIDKAIEGLEKQITLLRGIKANFEASEQKLLKANQLAETDLTVKKLTHGNPNVRKMIEDAAEE